MSIHKYGVAYSYTFIFTTMRTGIIGKNKYGTTVNGIKTKDKSVNPNTYISLKDGKEYFKGSRESNYKDYMKEINIFGAYHHKDNWYTHKYVDIIRVTKRFKDKDFSFNVYLETTMFKLLSGEQVELQMITTGRVDTSVTLGDFTFGRMSFLDDIRLMREGVIDMCRKHNLLISSELNSWNEVKVIVIPNEYYEVI